MRARTSERAICSLAIFTFQGVAGPRLKALGVVAEAFHVVLRIPGAFGVH